MASELYSEHLQAILARHLLLNDSPPESDYECSCICDGMRLIVIVAATSEDNARAIVREVAPAGTRVYNVTQRKGL